MVAAQPDQDVRIAKTALRAELQEHGLELVLMVPPISNQFTELEVRSPNHDLVIRHRITRKQLAEQKFERVVADIAILTWRAIKGGGTV